MALTCQMTVTPASYQAGQSPPPVASLQVFNPNAVAVSVTGIELVFRDTQGLAQRPPVLEGLPPIGIGQTTSVPSLGVITIAFPIAVANLASANSFQMVPPSSVPANPQSANPPQSQLVIGARVYGSDGSVNDAGPGGLLVSFANPPPLGFQGGFSHFSGPNNAVLLAAVG